MFETYSASGVIFDNFLASKEISIGIHKVMGVQDKIVTDSNRVALSTMSNVCVTI